MGTIRDFAKLVGQRILALLIDYALGLAVVSGVGLAILGFLQSIPLFYLFATVLSVGALLIIAALSVGNWKGQRAMQANLESVLRSIGAVPVGKNLWDELIYLQRQSHATTRLVRLRESEPEMEQFIARLEECHDQIVALAERPEGIWGQGADTPDKSYRRCEESWQRVIGEFQEYLSKLGIKQRIPFRGAVTDNDVEGYETPQDNKMFGKRSGEPSRIRLLAYHKFVVRHRSAVSTIKSVIEDTKQDIWHTEQITAKVGMDITLR